MNPLLSAAVLGAVQGLTEFLPVSSSGHLVLFQSFLPVTGDPLAFDLALHMGTLVPVFAVYGRDLRAMARDAFYGTGPLAERAGVRLLALLVVASAPTAAMGLLLERQFQALFGNPQSVGVAFAVTGTVLFSTRALAAGRLDAGTARWWQALLVGIAQGVAITPGISRSGSTIAGGLLLGFEREFAARFSFLLSVPAILGAFVLKAGELELGGEAGGPLLVGLLSSAVTGYLALRLLIRLVRAGDFSRFAWYLWPLAAVAFALAL